ncbi:MAG: sulfatase-like hydrolase/transferase [bacterium]|nr:sulfatase-like hydrolase/transferase [bacterium]
MLKRYLRTGAFYGFIYGLILLICEDIFALLLNQVTFSGRQITFSLVLYSVLFIFIGMIYSLIVWVFRRKSPDQETLFPAQILLFLCFFALFYLGYRDVPLRFFARTVRTQVPVAFFWGLLNLSVYWLIMKVLKRGTFQDVHNVVNRGIAASVMITTLIVINLRMDNDTYISNHLYPYDPLWRMVLILLALAFWLLFNALQKPSKERTVRNKFALKHMFILAVFSFILLLFSALWSANVHDRNNSQTCSDSYRRNSDSPPNIIIIIIDALRADHMSLYNYPRATTTQLDAYSRNAFVFDQALAPSSWTKQSIPSVLTSRYPGMIDVYGIFDDVPEDLLMIPEMLQTQRYYTVGFSANPLISKDFNCDQGFDEFHLIIRRGPKQLFFPTDVVSSHLKLSHECAFYMNLVDDNINYGDGRVVNSEVVPWLRRNAQSQFFMYLHYMDLHTPYTPSHQKYSKGKYLTSKDYDILWSLHDNFRDKPTETTPLDPHIVDIVASKYDDEIIGADKAAGEVLQLLQDLNIADHTLVFITADHGEAFGEHGLGNHGNSMYQELLHVPLIIHLPQSNNPPRRFPDRVGTLDIVPTICDQIGIAPPQNAVGISLLPLMNSPEQAHPLESVRTYLGEVCISKREIPYNNIFAVIKDNFKFICSELVGSGSYQILELYDLSTDPGERHNLIDEYPGLVDSLKAEINDYRKFCDSLKISTVRSDTKTRSEGLRDQLRALGYVP